MTVAFNFSGASADAVFAPAAALSGVSLLVEVEGGTISLPPAEGLARLAQAPHLLCHRGFVADRLALSGDAPRSLVRAAREQRHFDIAELFAFVCPARFAIPTPHGLARSLGLETWAEVEIDLGHMSLEGVEEEHVLAALLAGCGADVVVRE